MSGVWPDCWLCLRWLHCLSEHLGVMLKSSSYSETADADAGRNSDGSHDWVVAPTWETLSSLPLPPGSGSGLPVAKHLRSEPMGQCFICLSFSSCLLRRVSRTHLTVKERFTTHTQWRTSFLPMCASQAGAWGPWWEPVLWICFHQCWLVEMIWHWN